MNGYQGKTSIKLHGIVYPMTVNLAVIQSFYEHTGQDFFNVAVSALNAFQKSRDMDGFERVAELTKAVSMHSAAWLFYLAAKENNSQVQFDEIQEAVLMEGPLTTQEHESYPLLFINLCTFAIMGPVDEEEKKD